MCASFLVALAAFFAAAFAVEVAPLMRKESQSLSRGQRPDLSSGDDLSMDSEASRPALMAEEEEVVERAIQSMANLHKINHEQESNLRTVAKRVFGEGDRTKIEDLSQILNRLATKDEGKDSAKDDEETDTAASVNEDKDQASSESVVSIDLNKVDQDSKPPFNVASNQHTQECKVYVCPADSIKKESPELIHCGQACDSIPQVCCQTFCKSASSSFSCGHGYVFKANANQIGCPGSFCTSGDITDIDACCDRSCTSFVCPAGQYVQKKHAASIRCPTGRCRMNDASAQDACCDESCDGFDCQNTANPGYKDGQHRIPNASNFACDGGRCDPADNTDYETCCVDSGITGTSAVPEANEDPATENTVGEK